MDAALELDPLTDDAITSRFRVFQRVRGHRYSVDDVAVAWEAARARPLANRVADLGTGIGSVAIMLAHALPDAALATIEAQEISFALLEKNVARNGLASRITRRHGDLRDPDLLAQLGGERFELVTGTPPYFPAASSSPSTDSQRTHARIEMRGGVEDYLAAAARVVSSDGLVVVCADARRPERVQDGAGRAGLHPLTRRDIVPRDGKGALIGVWTLARAGAGFVRHPDVVLRDAVGARTNVQHELRAFFGLSIREGEAASP
jgi:tRNA1Val (adenine37-N6)-methyltransferase